MRVGEPTKMSGGSYISEQDLLQWYRLLKKRRFFGDVMLRLEGGEICMIEEQRKLKKRDIQDEFLRNQ